jgi:hypothetical protein
MMTESKSKNTRQKKMPYKSNPWKISTAFHFCFPCNKRATVERANERMSWNLKAH